MPDRIPPEPPATTTLSSSHLDPLQVPPDAAVAAFAPNFPAEEGTDWRRYATAIMRNRWWVVLGTALGLAGGIGAARVLKPQYMVQGTVWIDVANRQDVNRGPIRQSQLLEAYAWVDLLRSYTVLDNVVRQLRLYVSPGSSADAAALTSFDVAERFRSGSYRLAVDPSGKTFTLTSRGMDLQRGTVGEPVGAAFGFLWTPPAAALPAGRVISFSLVTPRDAARRLSEDLLVHLDENGNFMALELTGADPTALAAALNGIVERYVAVAADLKRAKLTELTHILDDQMSTAAMHLHSAEGALEEFRVRTITLPSEQASPVSPGLESTRDPVFKNFFELRIEREQLRRDRESIEQAIAHPADSGVVEGLEVVGAVQRSAGMTQALHELTTKVAELRAIRYHYTDEYPGAKRLAAEIETLEHRTIPTLARGLLGEIAARAQVLDTSVQSAGHELKQIPQRAVEEARLRREVAIAENLYTTLQQRYEEARLAEASTIPDVRVLDAAVAPQRPIKNTAPRIVLVGLFGGLGLSLLGVVLMDRFDTRIRYPQQVTREMGLQILGAVPHVGRGRRAPRPDDVTQVIEAVRAVRLNVAHAYGAAGPVLVTITSPGPGDGKSFVSGNLARAFADAGRRTLLIDGDTRRGVLHRVLKLSRRPGLIDYLSGDLPFERIVQATDHRWLSFIGSGSRAGDSPELLGSPAMARLLASARGSYQVVLIDSPPLGAGIDPLVLGALTGSLIIVLRTGATNRDLTHVKLEGIERLPIRVLGAVLNDVQPGGVYRYYSYLPGYAAEDEPRAPGASRVAPARGLPSGR